MRIFYTLLLAFGVSLAFGQWSPAKFVEHPRFINHAYIPHSESITRGVTNSCDSNDLLDYSSCAEVITLLQGGTASSLYGYNSNIHPVYIQPLSTFTGPANTGDATYMGMAFDTLAFQDYNKKQLFGYPLASSTITVNGLIYIYGYDADTIASDGLIANDSLVFKFYAIDNNFGLGIIDTVLAGQVVIAGDSLASLYTGTGTFGIRTIPANVSFKKGQGFFVRVEYLDKDTSSHFSLATTFIDSCGPITITYQGQTYSNQLFAGMSPLSEFVEYPAELAPGGATNFGLTFYGFTINGTVYNYDNEYNYQGAGFIPNPPPNCSFVTNQHICVMPIINVCTGYTAKVEASPPAGCPGSIINLAALVTGSTPTTTVIPNTLAIGGVPIGNVLHTAIGDSTLTYTWAASSGILSSTTAATPTLTMPASGNVTVSLIVNDGTGIAIDTTVIVNNPPIILNITNVTQPVPLNCSSTVTLQLSVSGASTGDTIFWTGPGIDTSGIGDTSLVVSLPGEYRVLAVNNTGCSANDSVSVVYANGVNNVVSFTAPAPVCINQSAQFTNTSTSITGWAASWTFGDGHTSDSLYTTTHSYTTSGNFSVRLSMDSGGCAILSPRINFIVNPVPADTVNVGGPTTFCASDSITLKAAAGLPQYLWSNGDTTRSAVISVSGNYAVTVTNQYGCTAASGNTVVIVNPLPSVTLSGFPANVCNTRSDTLTGGSPAGGAYSGQWVSQGIFHANLANNGPYVVTYTYTDNNTCTNAATGTLTVQTCAGINEAAFDNLHIFPNPTGDVINIYSTGNEPLTADLTDVSGKTLAEGLVITGTAQTINLSAYSAGVYLLKLHDKSGAVRVVKVVKE